MTVGQLTTPEMESAIAGRPPSRGGVSLARLRPFLLLIFAFNLVSAGLFIARVNRLRYDDVYNITDVHNYAVRGLSVASIKSQTNAPGPLGFAWLALGVRLIGGEELRDARLAALFSWVLIFAVIFVGSRYSRSPELWLAALLTLLVFPHAAETTALVLSEGPALLFATLGSLLWLESIGGERATAGSAVIAIGGGLSMGLAVACRQYYLALLPAAALFALLRSKGRDRKWWAGVVASLTAAAIPVLALIVIWKGITCPGIASGASYSNWRASAGLNVFRPFIAAFYMAFYLLLLTFPVTLMLKAKHRWAALLLGCAAGLAAAPFHPSILQPGPLRTTIYFLAHGPIGRLVLFGVIAAAVTCNAVAFASFVWDRRRILGSCAPFLFALLVICLFVGEQIGVGGNLFLYERYTLQMAPFLGLVAFAALPRLTYPRLMMLAAMFAVSHIMLWRWAFGA